ncbi:hypothetical protein Lfu02_79330 [Longispora fulva]|uniref:Glycoside hydrolase family 29 N-terminal domain-containing protein n=1 Tax=Longispora fulva TaxID=619741 RepID=A0A8J7G5H8_9ACTN|nr:alpha-L-fucosidase [Longispora fulva]MBG6134043.1 hypothetical protein [Longispora fulva]GIG63561.1 hypothetical protein Lfu02_79330 [Longispora fulva]
MRSRLPRALAMALCAAIAATVAAATPAAADTIIPQAGPNPVVITPGTGSDDVVALPASAAERTSAITNTGGQGDIAKNFHVQHFLTTADYLAWTVSVPAAASYRFAVLLNASSGQQFTLTVRGTATSVSFTSSGGWLKIDAGTLALPAGSSTVELRRAGSPSGDTQVKSVELIRDSDYAAYQQRVATGRAAADLTWLRQAKYGLMFQYGSWGFPAGGGPAKTLEQQANDFNVPAFVNTVKQTGAAYVIWSFSWWGYRPDMPNTALDTIMANGGASTSQRDLIGEVAAALHAENIRFALYYHEGKEEATFWQKENYPSSFPATGTGDRSTFFTNWKNVVGEIGQRLGTNLDGFFFDDAMTYYPAKFEELHAVARTGNPARTVTWNNWVYPRLTEFQDVSMGENYTGDGTVGSPPAGGDGIFTAGPDKGLLEHGMFIMENDWGVHQQGQQIGATTFDATWAISHVTSAAARSVPLTFDLMMYEDGTMSAQSLAVLQQLKAAVRGTTGVTTVNNTDAAISYTGSWSVSGNRGAGDYADDVRYTSVNGDSVAYTFTGSGIDLLTEKYSDQGNIDVYIDNVFQQTVNTSNSTRLVQQAVYSKTWPTSGSHTIKAVKKDGSYMLLDAFRVHQDVTVNNTDASIAYTGAWSVSSNRGVGDYADDVRYTMTNGDAVSYTFTGTGIDLLTEKFSDQGNVDIYIDNVFQQTVNTTNPTRLVQQAVYSKTWPTSGSHTIKAVKKDGTYMLLDAFRVYA